MLDDYAGWIAIASVVLVLLLAWAIAAVARSETPGIHRPRRRRRPPRHAFGGRDDEQTAPKRAGIIINPSKFNDLAGVKRRVVETSRRAGWGEPLFIETTTEDPGTGQAHQAVAEGVDLVCPLGGDGTVRAVAEALAGTETPMGLLPGGTSNLLARNLGLPVDSVEEALKVAMTGRNLRMDVGRMIIHRAAAEQGAEAAPETPNASADAEGESQEDKGLVFLVMAGLGFDADIMAGASEEMKARVGWPAYFVSGVKNLRGRQFKVSFGVDGQAPLTRRTRSVVVGNCGRLVGGLTLMPDADVTDGHLDAVIISPKGIVGWAAVAGQVISKRRKGHERLDRHTGQEFAIMADRPQEVQLDGDTIGQVLSVTVNVEPRALTVRTAGS
ncbi:MAG TPA: diacylglycerol kinase family protein [Dermatophilaceae bacterium]|nr:diacylglycerol kinase family protein [Dermatophilaceae bacterium]